MRVLPLENEAVNECWIADRDRFSYEALNTDQRLTDADDQAGRPVAGGRLEHRARLRGARARAASRPITAPQAHRRARDRPQHGRRAAPAGQAGARPRQREHRPPPAPQRPVQHRSQRRWRPEGALARHCRSPSCRTLQRALVIGSFLRKDHPLFALRIRQAARRGAQVHSIHAVDDDWLMPMATRVPAAPSGWAHALADIAAAIGAAAGKASPWPGNASDGCAGDRRVRCCRASARPCCSATRPRSIRRRARCWRWRTGSREQTGATVGYLGEGGQHGRRPARRRAARPWRTGRGSRC